MIILVMMVMILLMLMMILTIRIVLAIVICMTSCFFVILWLVKVLWLPWLIDIVITGVVTCTTIGRLLSKDDAKNRLQYSIIRPCFQDYHDIFSEGLKPPTRYIICWRMRWLIFLTLRQKAEKPTPGAPIGGLGDAARLADQMHDSILCTQIFTWQIRWCIR